MKLVVCRNFPFRICVRGIGLKMVLCLSIVFSGTFDDAFIDYLFDLVEQTRHMHNETFNYSVIKLIVSNYSLLMYL